VQAWARRTQRSGNKREPWGGGGPAGPAGDGPLAGCMPEERQQAKWVMLEKGNRLGWLR
jgi:hypothetical protein